MAVDLTRLHAPIKAAWGDDALIFTPAGGSPASFTGVVRDPFVGLEDSPGVLAIVETDEIEPVKGDAITIGSTAYRVFSSSPDKVGWRTISLTK